MSTNNTIRAALEAASAIGVILGLIFVGLELRHSNNLSQAEALLSLNGLTITMEMSKYNMPASDDLWVRVGAGTIDDKKNLSPMDQNVLSTYYTMLINLTESAWKFRDTGILGEAETEGYLKAACDILSQNDLSKKFWYRKRANFTLKFVAELEENCAELKSKD